jgi:hypothetical protein
MSIETSKFPKTPRLTCFKDIVPMYLWLFLVQKYYFGIQSLVAQEATSRQFVVKLELVRSVAENSRKHNVVFRHSSPAIDLSALPRCFLLSVQRPDLLTSILWLVYR